VRRPRRPFPAIYAAAALSLAYLGLMTVMPPAAPDPAVLAAMRTASDLMARAEAAVRTCREGRGVPIEPAADPNRTGLIGEETSEITTSAGRLEAKRTTTNPAFAGLVVSLLHEAGVRRGDAVAVGASEWGGNIPGFSWLDMEDCLRRAGLVGVVPIARAVGGEEDVGRDMAPEGRAMLAARIRAEPVPFLEEPDLERNVACRLALYRAAAGDRPIKAFVNIGGSWANLGTDPEILKVEPGLAGRVTIPPPPRRGVLQAMAAAGVPVIHLLNVRGLCERYGLPWDPRPLPAAGPEGPRRPGPSRPAAIALTGLYVLAVVIVLAAGRRRA
jgi:hypothetical protein